MTTWAWVVAASVLAADVRAADERIVLRTGAGDIVLALFPDVAPGHVQQLLALTRLGVYDGTHFSRVVPNFVAQVSTAQDRLVPLTPEQKAAIRPLKAEFSRLKHKRGILSMARQDGQPDSADTSFSILLGDVPHLDEKYTIFGQVEQGMDVIEQFLNVPRDKPANSIDADPNQPRVRLTITKAEVVLANDLANAKLALARPLLMDASAYGLPQAGVKVGSEYVKLATSAGDLLLALYPEAAPQAVPQILQLAKHGVYNSTPFVFVEPRFILQLGGARERAVPLSADQQALLRPLTDPPNQLRHRRGIVSLVREPQKSEADPSALLILLGDAPQLDGKYTVVGHVERGWDVLDRLAAVPRLPNPNDRQQRQVIPAQRIEVGSAQVVSAEQLASLQLSPGREVVLSTETRAMMEARQELDSLRQFARRITEALPFIAGTIALMLILTGVLLVGRERLAARYVSSLHMTNLLVGSFGLLLIFVLMWLLPKEDRPGSWLALLVFFGLLGLLRLLGRFENPS